MYFMNSSYHHFPNILIQCWNHSFAHKQLINTSEQKDASLVWLIDSTLYRVRQNKICIYLHVPYIICIAQYAYHIYGLPFYNWTKIWLVRVVGWSLLLALGSKITVSLLSISTSNLGQSSLRVTSCFLPNSLMILCGTSPYPSVVSLYNQVRTLSLSSMRLQHKSNKWVIPTTIGLTVQRSSTAETLKNLVFQSNGGFQEVWALVNGLYGSEKFTSLQVLFYIVETSPSSEAPSDLSSALLGFLPSSSTFYFYLFSLFLSV